MNQKLRKHLKRAALLALLLGSAQVISPQAFAQQAGAVQTATAPRTLSYQGVLSNTGGTKASGPHVLTVTLYGDAAGTQKLWQQTMNTQVDSNGVFNTTLGTDANPLPEPAVMDRPIWLGVAVDNGPELRPLSEMTASAYALNVVDNAITTPKLADGAVTAGKIADSSITTAKIADHSITWNKMGTEYVPYIRVNGAKVNTGSNSINFTGEGGLRVAFDTNSYSVIIRPDSAQEAAGTGKGPHPMSGWDPTFTNSDNGMLGSGIHATSTNTVGGGTNNTAYGGVSPDLNGRATVAGGQGNTAEDTFATIGGGDTNTASGYESTISGGTFNNVNNRDGFIGGGLHNTNKSKYSALAGGDANLVDTQTDASFMGGGLANRIGYYGNSQTVGDTTYIGADVLGGGRNNFVKSTQAALVGGNTNTIDTDEDEAFIGAGANNLITQLGDEQGIYAAIVAGYQNYVRSQGGFIGAGASDTVLQQNSGIIAGKWNVDSGVYSVIGAGEYNHINGRNPYTSDGGQSFIGAGIENTITASGSFVGTGEDDTILTFGASAVSGEFAKIESASDYSFIGAGVSNLIDTGSPDASITGGVANVIDTNSPFSAIVAGDTNIIAGSEDAIASGHTNTIGVVNPGWVPDNYSIVPSNYSFIGGGKYNFISGSDGSVIAGGTMNGIGNYGNPSGNSFIGGGDDNQINYSPNGVIAGGGMNSMNQSQYATIGGGYANNLGNFNNGGTIAGGEWNVMRSKLGAIGGGDSNHVNAGTSAGGWGTVGGGHLNIENGAYGTIGGGVSNWVFSIMGTVGGGYNNLAGFNGQLDSFTVVAGGHLNNARMNGAAISGGINNQAVGTEAYVGGGSNDHSEANFSAIGGGNDNYINAEGGFIGGGDTNEISDAPIGCGLNGPHDNVIGGGHLNKILGGISLEFITLFSPFNAIAGGDTNTIWYGDTACAVGGGQTNAIDTLVQFGTVGGGKSNVIVADFSGPFIAPTISGGMRNAIERTNEASIGGGESNRVTSKGPFATIPGGDSLTANSFAQTVVGYNNRVTGSAIEGISHVGIDTPLFIVGNGNDGADQSNAFEVSYDGHSTVFDQNGTGGASLGSPRPALYGSSYQDNIVYAWADVPMGTGPYPNPLPMTVNADFGVESVWHTAPGTYVVTLETAQGAGLTPINLQSASITVTVQNNDTTGITGSIFSGAPIDSTKTLATNSCGYATASQIGLLATFPSTFIVHTYLNGGSIGDCTEQDRAFFFKVVGRK